MSASVAESTLGIGCGIAQRYVLEYPSEEIISGEHADSVAVIDRGGVDAAARLRVVDDVVVNERRNVDELHVCREVKVLDRFPAAGLGAEQRDARAQALPAGRQHSLDGLGDDGILRRESRAKELLDESVEIVGSRRARNRRYSGFRTVMYGDRAAHQRNVAGVTETGAREALAQLRRWWGGGSANWADTRRPPASRRRFRRAAVRVRRSKG